MFKDRRVKSGKMHNYTKNVKNVIECNENLEKKFK